MDWPVPMVFTLTLVVGFLQVQQRGWKRRVPWVTIVLSVATLAVGAFAAFDTELVDALQPDADRFASGEWWRVFTPLVAAHDLFELFVMLGALVIVSLVAENLFGSWLVLVVYIAAGVAAELLANTVLADRAFLGGSPASFGLVGLILATALWVPGAVRFLAAIAVIGGLLMLATLSLHGIGFAVGALVGTGVALAAWLKTRQPPVVA